MYKSFKEMSIWQEAMDISVEGFKLTENLPKKEDYGLTSQIRRSAVSISGNIAEAYGRHHMLDKINIYYFSRGSLTETQSHLEYGRRVGYFDSGAVVTLDSTLETLHKDLNKVILSLKSSTKSQPQP